MLTDLYGYIETQIKTVSGVDADTVHRFKRNTNNWQEIFNLFKDDDNNINAWIIRFKSAPAEWHEHKAYRILRTWTFDVWGMYNIVDADPSVTTFETMTEGIANALSLSPSAGDNADLAEPAQITSIDEVMFASILCHRAMLEVSAKELLDPSSP